MRLSGVFGTDPSGIVRVEELDAATGDLVRMGQTLGLVQQLRTEEARVACLDGTPALGADVEVLGPPGPLGGDDVLGEVIDALGRPLHGGARRTATRPGEVSVWTGRPASTLFHTGIASIDVLAPVAEGSSAILTGEEAADRLSLLLTLASLDRPHRVVWCAVGAPERELVAVRDGLHRAGVLDRTVLVASPSRWPASGHLATLPRAAMLARDWQARGHRVLLVLAELTRHADAARAVAPALGWGRDPFGWPHGLAAAHGAAADVAMPGELGSVTVIATADGDRAGLDRYLEPWFDHRIALVRGAPGSLPTVDLAWSTTIPALPTGSARHPPDLRGLCGDLRTRLGQAEGKAARLAPFGTGEPELVEARAEARRLRACLSQRRGEAVDAGALHARLAAQGVDPDRR